jgi:hypothetical protein
MGIECDLMFLVLCMGMGAATDKADDITRKRQRAAKGTHVMWVN